MFAMTLADSHLTRGALSNRVSVTNLRQSSDASWGLDFVADSIASMQVPRPEPVATFAASITSTALTSPSRSIRLIASTLALDLICLSVSKDSKSIFSTFLSAPAMHDEADDSSAENAEDNDR